MRKAIARRAGAGALHSAYAFDGLRAVLIVLVVAGHAVIAFVNATPGLPWPVRDRPWGWVFDVLAWWLLGVTIPAFLVLAGITLEALAGTMAPAKLLRNRARRLVAPFLLAAVVLLPLTYAVFSLGWYASGRCTWKEIFQLRFHDPEIKANLWGPAHLWFLEFLIICTFGIIALRELAQRWRQRPRASTAPTEGARVEARALALGLAGMVAVVAGIIWATPAICTRYTNSFLPEPGRLLFAGAFMAGGMWLHRHRSALGLLARWSWPLLVLSQLAFVPAAAQLLRVLRDGLAPAWTLLAPAIGGFVVLAAAGSLGLTVRLYRRSHPSLRFLAEASAWIYLSNLPVVALLQVELLYLQLHPLAKFVIVVMGTLAIILPAFHLLRRRATR
ncbi:MAG: acyltransferase family protein [Acidobacteriota bacterium]